MTLAGLWNWWWREISAMLPERLRPRQEEQLALWRPGQVALWRRGPDGALPVKQPSQPLVLRLPGHKIWRRHFTLPRKAQPFLRQIFDNEMERRTPWRAEQIYYDLAAERHPEDRASLDVTLTVLPRKSVEPALAAMSAQGLPVDRVELSEDDDPALPGPVVAVADGKPVASAGGGGRRPALILGSLAGLALVSLVVQGIWQAAIEAELRGLRQQSADIRSLAADVAKLQRRQHFPSLRQREAGSVLAVLNGLARALPDDSWAEEVDIADGQVSVTGNSADSSRLLALLQTQGFAAAEFRGAQDGKKFLIHARVPHDAP